MLYGWQVELRDDVDQRAHPMKRCNNDICFMATLTGSSCVLGVACDGLIHDLSHESGSGTAFKLDTL